MAWNISHIGIFVKTIFDNDPALCGGTRVADKKGLPDWEERIRRLSRTAQSQGVKCE